MNCIPVWLRSILIVLTVTCSAIAQGNTPTLVLTSVPPYGSYNPLQGVATGVSPQNYEVAVLIFIEGLGWYSKPYCNSLAVPLASDGTWSTSITTGGVDQTATRIAAYLLPSNVTLSCVSGAGGLPGNLESSAVASALATRVNPNLRTINFSGRTWWLKANSVKLGPGPNYFSDSIDNVWVDGQGRLHLKITNVNGAWYCAEIVSQNVLGFGRNIFTLDSAVDGLDPNVVFGLFTWSDDDPSYSNREIDIEFSKFSNASDTNNAQYVVQPYNVSGNLIRFQIPSGFPQTTHMFDWQPSQVQFESVTGSALNAPGSTTLDQWNYTGSVPPPGDQNVRMNLWLFNSQPPTNGQEAEVIVRSYKYIPPPLNLTVYRPSNGTWYVLPNSNPNQPVIQQFGVSGDIAVPGDYDGDGQQDFAVYRPSDGTWYVIPSSHPTQLMIQQFGISGDIPVPGDYDGDGKQDFAVYRPSNGTWYVIPSSNPNTLTIQQFGISNDIPIPGDFDGDGKQDFAVYRPSNGTWYVLPSSNPGQVTVQQFGISTDVPVPGDYDGDGKQDFAVYRPSTGTWYVLPSSNPGQLTIQQFGASNDIPVPGDFDGDGKQDFAVYRPSTGFWYIIPSSNPNTYLAEDWGTSSDIPLPQITMLRAQSVPQSPYQIRLPVGNAMR